jgi:intracellular sulfur oxidation DsrE/DsrF family protein
MSQQPQPLHERRSFFTRLNAGAASLAAFALGGVALQGKTAKEKSHASARFEPARHEKDDWLDKLPGKHRLIFDTTNAQSVADALLFTNNFLRVNKTEYGVDEKDLAVVIVVRHRSTPFGYNDAMWAKYGASYAGRAQFVDPKTKQPPTGNVYAHGEALSFEAFSKLGVQLAVCATASRAYAAGAAEATGSTVDAVFAEMTSNLVVPTARMVPAGIITVSRAQERGYTLVTP